MPVHDTEDPRAQAQQMIADARQAFAKDVDGLLAEIQGWTSQVHDTTFGEVSRGDLLRALRTFVLEKFEQRLPPPRSLADVLQLQVQREVIAELVGACKGALEAFSEWEGPEEEEAPGQYDAAVRARNNTVRAYEAIRAAIAKAEGADG